MAISFDKALGIHELALNTRVRRAEVLANNLANADTPGYKARDLDFRAILAQAGGDGSGLELARSDPGHMSAGDSGADGELMYRNPLQPSIDGNTVDAQQEQAAFMRNAMDYQASFQFLNNSFTGLTKALRGE